MLRQQIIRRTALLALLAAALLAGCRKPPALEPPGETEQVTRAATQAERSAPPAAREGAATYEGGATNEAGSGAP